MAEPSTPGHNAPAKLFADLRRRNARVAQMLTAKRKRQIEHVLQAQRKHRIHQAR